MATSVVEMPSTRDRILDASLSAFAARGVDATSLDALAGEVGVRKQTILYWFPSKQHLLLGVVDHAVAELGAELTAAALAAEATLTGRIRAVVDATFRLGSTRPELLAVVREVTRVGPPASTRLATAAEPLVELASTSLARADGAAEVSSRTIEEVRRVVLASGARVIGLATEAEVRADLGLAPDLAWLRRRRRALLDDLLDQLA